MPPKDSSSAGGGDTKNRRKKDEYLSEEDLALKQQLEVYVKTVHDSDPGLQKAALESLRQEIQYSNKLYDFSSKAIKVLASSFRNATGKLLADILSILAFTMSSEGEREILKYKLLGSEGDVGLWGHDYVRNLTVAIVQEYERRQIEKDPIVDLMDLVEKIVAFHMKHNAEPEAVDLLMEVEDLYLLLDHVDSVNYKRACLYLASLAKYFENHVYAHAYIIYMQFEEFPRALQIALYFDAIENARDVITSCNDILKKQQLCFIIARHGVAFDLDEVMCEEDEERKGMQQIISNAKLSEGYLTLARDIEVMEPKSPEDIYKSHLLDGRARSGESSNSARQNLAAIFVNAFVNAGFGQDKLLIGPAKASSGDSSTSWLFKHKEHAKASAAASLGMIMLWDVDCGLAQIDKYSYSSDPHIIAGALLGVGIVNCRVKHDCDPAYALLADYVHNKESSIRIGAIMGLGIAYAGAQDEKITRMLTSIIQDAKESLDVIVFSAISVGLVQMRSGNKEVARAIIFVLKNLNDSELGEPLNRLLPLGLGLLYLQMEGSVNATAESLRRSDKRIGQYCYMTLISCAYAGTGDVLKVQHFLDKCTQRCKKGKSYHGPAVLGIAMVAMAEELGLEMAIRSLEHLLQYGEQNIRTAVPLALGLLCISNPKVNVTNTLRRLSHDGDTEVAMAAIVSLGLIGAGTNNARIAGLLRNLSTYYYRDPDLLFCVRIAQGLVHLGKGLLTLSPYHSERFLLSPISLAGLVIVLHACLDLKAIILEEYHYVLYFLVLAIQPRMLMTVDENLKPLSVPVHVGQAVDVGQAGCPKTITGFQTLSTPILLSAGERAELATERYVPLSPILEGFVILKENTDYKE
ncbi:26S proteasome non-ATPase regulatory subunit 2-like protein A [Forsythia ovata]|uniref:26S proteasome non-ATPase regulatory subunit 2 homolog n=1 Tax=Forsythia ovata TaxID=205694 RepID=A0ABD1R829_9LAMI